MSIRVLPPQGPPRRLALAQLTNSIGDGAFYVCSALFFSRVVGLSATQIGLGLTIGWAVGFVAGIPLGHLADRRGPRGIAVLLALATAAAITALLFVRSFPLFVLAACVYATCQCGLGAARQALLAGLVDSASRTSVRAYLQSTTNAGLAVGAALGGIALYADTAPAYLTVLAMDAASFLACATVLRRLPPVPTAPPSTGGPSRTVLRDRPYALLAVLNMVMQLHIPLITLAIPLWIVQRTAAPGWLVSALLVLNTGAVVLFQVRVARRAPVPERRSPLATTVSRRNAWTPPSHATFTKPTRTPSRRAQTQPRLWRLTWVRQSVSMTGWSKPSACSALTAALSKPPRHS